MTSELTISESPARARFREALAAGDRWRAMQLARSCLRDGPTIRNYRFVRTHVENCKHRLALKPYRMALLSSFSIEFVADPLIVHGFLEGLDIEIYQSGFAQFRQELTVRVSTQSGGAGLRWKGLDAVDLSGLLG